MTQAPHRVIEARPPRPGDPVPMDVVVLAYDDRYLRRRVLTCQHGDRVLIDLDTARPLADRERLVLATGAHVEVIAADEALIEVTAPTPGDLARYAWHIGNRHMTCAIAAGHLLVRRDHVLADMLTRLGARLRPVDAPFDPEGGAYGHGRTHDHGHPDAPRPRAPDWQTTPLGFAPHTHGTAPHTHAPGTAPHTHPHGAPRRD